jgi:hypothetical protein
LRTKSEQNHSVETRFIQGEQNETPDMYRRIGVERSYCRLRAGVEGSET